jgi:GGDEF domain-containing protein
MTGFNKPRSQESAASSTESSGRFLTLLTDGISVNMPDIGTESYREFRANLVRLGLQIPDRLPDDDKLRIIQGIIHEIERYRQAVDDEFRERRNGWRALAAMMLRYILGLLNIDPSSSEAAALLQRIASLLHGAETQSFRVLLTDFLRLHDQSDSSGTRSSLRDASRSVSNDNATGLRGGGVAVKHLKELIAKDILGFIVIFRLGCMDVIEDRFGMNAVQDTLMAVASYLTHALRNEDTVYHWSDNALLGILPSSASQKAMLSAVQRIIDNNRDITIQVDNHTVMVRVPLDFEVFPINLMRSPEDLYKLLPQSSRIN